MIRRFFIWRAHKKLARTRYKLDRREYRGQFRSGFMSHLQQARFWDSESDPYYRRQRWKKRILWLLVIALAGFSVWVAIESMKALQIFE